MSFSCCFDGFVRKSLILKYIFAFFIKLLGLVL